MSEDLEESLKKRGETFIAHRYSFEQFANAAHSCYRKIPSLRFLFRSDGQFIFSFAGNDYLCKHSFSGGSGAPTSNIVLSRANFDASGSRLRIEPTGEAVPEPLAITGLPADDYRDLFLRVLAQISGAVSK